MRHSTPTGVEAALVFGGFCVTVFSVGTGIDVAVAALCFWAVTALSGLSPRAVGARLKPFLFFAAMAVLFGALGEGETLWAIGPLHFSREALQQSFLAGSRLALFGIAAIWVSLGLGTARLTALLYALCRRADRIGLRLGAFITAFSVAVRFLPVLQDEASSLRLAWQARGGELGGLGFGGRIRSTMGMAVPLLAMALRRAEAHAEAVDVRTGGTGEYRWIGQDSSVAWDEGERRAVTVVLAGMRVVLAWLLPVMQVARWML